jgi:hypothetical protein
MTMPIQDFFENMLTPAIQKLSPKEKAEFRQAWWAQIVEREKTAENDRRFLKSVGIDPDGD